MGIFEIVLFAVGLAMDAFAVSICKGLSLKKLKKKYIIMVGAYFGVFQAVMPLIGYGLGHQFKNQITSIDHWIAFGLLVLIGGHMLKESFEKEKENHEHDHEAVVLPVKEMLILAVATSIDALAVGITFSFLEVQIIEAVSIIGIVTFIISCTGVLIGFRFGTKYKNKAELFGGIVLILLGCKILLEHSGVILF